MTMRAVDPVKILLPGAYMRAKKRVTDQRNSQAPVESCEKCAAILARLQQHIADSHKDSTVIEPLLVAFAADRGVELCELMGRSQKPEMVAIRRAFAAKARTLGYSLPAIGRALGRHHTTVLNLLVGKGWQGR